MKSWRDLYREKDLSWWPGAHSLRSINHVAGFFWDAALYAQEARVMFFRVLRRYCSKIFSPSDIRQQ